jgi:hypothetical protein
MGGTLTKELLGSCWCQYLPARACLFGVRCGCGGGTSRVGSGGLVEHTVGSSGHRPPVGGVPGTGRSLDHEPLRLLPCLRVWVG